MSALSGIRVVDLTQYEAGTGCTQNLAWLGADVIKVEPLKGEAGRISHGQRLGLREHDDHSEMQRDLDAFYFLVHNANKRSLTLDLRSERGAELLRRLCHHSDVFVENFAPGAIERLGFSYEEIRKINPRLIYAQIKGFDPDGPYGDFLSFNNVAQPAGGIMSVTGLPGGPPMMAGLSVADSGTGLYLALGIVAALYQRESTGRGQQVRVAMQEAMISMARVHHGQTQMTGKPAERRGNGYAVNNAPADIYPCPPFGPNDFIAIYTSRAVDSHHWERLLQVIGRTDLKEEERFSSPDRRSQNAKEIDDLINAWVVHHNKREAMELLQRAGVPAGAVFDTLELQRDPHLQKNGTFVAVDHPERGSFAMPGMAIRMSDSHVPVVAAPLLGQHSREVLSELLNFGTDELEELERSRVTSHRVI